MLTETFTPNLAPILAEKPKAARADEPWCAPGTGFDVRAESNKFIRTLQDKARSGQSVQSAMDELITFASEDLTQWAMEFPMKRLVFLYYLEEDEATGELVAPKFNRQTFVTLSDEVERLGKVRLTAHKVQAALKAAAPGEAVLNVSPPGKTWKPSMPEHVDNMAFVYEKLDERSYRARTLRTKMDLDQTEALQKRFGFHQELDNPTVEDRILNVVSGVGTLKLETGQDAASCVLEAMREIRRAHGFEDAYEGRGFDELEHDIALGDRLIEANMEVNKFVLPLVERMQLKINGMRSSFNQARTPEEMMALVTEVEKLIGETMMKIGKSIREGQLVDMETSLTDEEVRDETAYLKELDGCSTSPSEDTVEITVMFSQGPRKVRVPKSLPCPKCGAKILVKSQIVSCKCGARLDIATDPCLGG